MNDNKPLWWHELQVKLAENRPQRVYTQFSRIHFVCSALLVATIFGVTTELVGWYFLKKKGPSD